MGNQYKSDYDIVSILNKILTVIGPSETEESVPFSFNTFKKIMITYVNIKPVISCERTLRQWYNNLIVCEFITGGKEKARFYSAKAYQFLDDFGGVA